VVLVGVAVGRFPSRPCRRLDRDPREVDETVPLAKVFEWARPQELPVVVIPGAITSSICA